MESVDWDVICVGFGCLDVLIPFVGTPAYDRKTEVSGVVIEGGGPASTAAVALRRLGCRVRLITAMGTDSFGKLLLEGLQREDLSTDAVLLRDGSRTPVSILLADPVGGARTNIWERGTVTPPTAAELCQLWRPAKVLLVDENYPEAATQALQLAHAAGMKVVFDAGNAAPGQDRLVRESDLLIASEEFPVAWTGISDPIEATRELQRQNGHPILVTRGSAGAWIHDGRTLQTFPATPVQAIDSTAAGDAFHAAMTFALLQNWPLERGCRFANYFAAQNCLHLGGRTGLLRLDQIQCWLDSESPADAPKAEVAGKNDPFDTGPACSA